MNARQAKIGTFLAVAGLMISMTTGVKTKAQKNMQDSPLPSTPHDPPPENLQVLPKGMSGQEVREMMETWSQELGVRCVACHMQDPVATVPGPHAEEQFTDDSKPMKAVARLMYTMTEEINGSFIAKVDGSGIPVTCGTCHRGNISPEPFVPVLRKQPQELRTSAGAASSSTR